MTLKYSNCISLDDGLVSLICLLQNLLFIAFYRIVTFLLNFRLVRVILFVCPWEIYLVLYKNYEVLMLLHELI